MLIFRQNVFVDFFVLRDAGTTQTPCLDAFLPDSDSHHLNEPKLLIWMVLLLVSALCKVALNLGFLAADQEPIVFSAIMEFGLVVDGVACLIGCTRSWSLVRRLIGFMRCWSVLGRLIGRPQ